MAGGGSEADSWLQHMGRLLAMEDGEGDPAENLAEALRLLRALHSEDVSDTFLRELWQSTSSWKDLRQKEALLRAVANEYAAATQWHTGSADGNLELLRPPYVPELLTEVASAVAATVQANPGRVEEKSGPSEAEKYVLEKDDDGGINLFIDPGGNLETLLPASENSTSLLAPTATSPADWHCVEALCKVCCDDALCKHPRSLCWHCWRREETAEQHPEELRDLLSYARSVAETAAPLQRAAEVALSWPFLEDVAAATVEKLQTLPTGCGVLVLGGVGVSAVRAARECGARVVIWEPRSFLAMTLRAVAAANDLGQGSIDVIDGGLLKLEIALKSVGFHLKMIIVEGLEMDGLLGFGTLKQLRSARSLISRLPGVQASSLHVLPSSLHIAVRLADAKVAEVSRFDFTAFARVSKAFAPFLSACPTNATSAKPKTLTEEVEAFNMDLEAVVAGTDEGGNDNVWDWPDAEFDGTTLQLKPLADVQSGSAASAVCVSFAGSFGSTSPAKKWGESIFYIPPVLTSGEATLLTCYRNSAKIWFEVETQPTTPLSNMPLHGPPFGHAYLQEWYLDMYRDVDRNDFYEEGLRRWVQKHRRQNGDSGKAGRVMDIGSGTGLLLFFALRAGAAESVGVEVAPNLKRMSEALFAANVRAGKLPNDVDFKIIHNDALCLALPEEERPHCLVTEMMDGSGFGENMVRVILHAKAKLLAKGAEGQIVPRKLVIKAVLLNIGLPRIGGVDLSPLEAYWGPTRALGCEGEFANLDLDNPEAGVCNVVSKVVEVWSVDFAKSAEDIAEALRAHMVEFQLTGSEELTVNAVAWWFEAHLDDSDGPEPPPPILTNVPVRLREGPTGGGTHWHQAVSAVGPFRRQPGSGFSLKAHTDGKKVTWTSTEPVAMSVSIERTDAMREVWLDFARKAEEQAQRSVWQRQRMAQDVSDAPRLAALQAAAMHVGAQPGLFGVFGGSSVASHILKEWFGAGCSAGF
mmetsp:Transcript_888/g.2030  ORF Transcript_888/g.2030 Transcript_888/m.2030 type:complete len:979 (-) Transcript_888:57-2993(-)